MCFGRLAHPSTGSLEPHLSLRFQKSNGARGGVVFFFEKARWCFFLFFGGGEENDGKRIFLEVEVSLGCGSILLFCICLLPSYVFFGGDGLMDFGTSCTFDEIEI